MQQRNLVIVAALNGDSEGCMWPSISVLIPFCKEIKLFNAVCEFDGQDAQMTFRCDPGIEQIAVNAKYMPACEQCWDEQTTRKMAGIGFNY